MRGVETEHVLMRVFVGETHQWERRPLRVALLDLFRQRGLAGATVLRAVTGFVYARTGANASGSRT